MIKVIGFILMLLFLGCSYKINPNEFAPINAKKAPIQPTPQELSAKTQILIVPKTSTYSNYTQLAASQLKALLSTYPPVVVIERKFTSIDDEIKLAEEAKKANTNLNQADYIIFVKVTSLSTNSIYHPPAYYRDKKGKIHRTKAYYTHSACVSGNFTILKIPQQVSETLPFYKCESQNTPTRSFDYSSLLTEAVISAVNSQKENLYQLFAKRGYVFEIRKKGDDTIIHTTLGSEFGAKEGERVNIYTIKPVKEPFSNKISYVTEKIGEGEISNVITPNSSWIVVKKTKEPIKIGDFVKINYHYSILDRLKDFF